jgi:hypothetical protein
MKKRTLQFLLSSLLLFLMQCLWLPAEGKYSPTLEECFQDTVIRSRDKLSAKDSLLVDSILQANRNAAKQKYVRLLAEGKIPVGIVNINYNNILSYNLFEGFKIGIGAETNRLLSKYVSFGGYFTYGLNDESIRHGSWVNIYPKGYYDFRIFMGYRDINMEYGESEFLEKKSLLNPESYRSLLVKNMFSTKRYTIGVEFRPIDELNTYLFSDLSDNTSRPVNNFLSQHAFPVTRLTRIGLQLRYSLGIQLVRDPDILIEKSIPRSDWFLTAIRGMNILGGELGYTKFEFKGRYKFNFADGSNIRFIARSGYISDNAPLIELFNGNGSYASAVSFIAPFSFNTMRQNEFAATQFEAVHLRYEFGRNFFSPSQSFRPVFVFSQNTGIGFLSSANSIKYQMTDFRKGYYESGFEVNNLLRMDFLSWGVGIYYRYGPYHLPAAGDNFAYKFGFYINL